MQEICGHTPTYPFPKGEPTANLLEGLADRLVQN